MSENNLLPFEGKIVPYLKAGYFGNRAQNYSDYKKSGYPMYYNGILTVSRLFNAVWNSDTPYGDYAEAIFTSKSYSPKEIVIENNTYQGICSNSFLRCTGGGNTIVGLMGRLELEKPKEKDFKIGDVLYYDIETKEIKTATSFKETKGNIIGKVLKINNNQIEVILM